MKDRVYIAIDLKAFYASVECIARGLNPLHTHLVVADESRTEKTICLAVSPSLKAYGITGRPRLFEVIQQVKAINAQRLSRSPSRSLTGSSYLAPTLKADPALALDYIVAPPHMARYVDYSVRIYQIYLKYVAAEDIHVYSIDEVFVDATDYLPASGLTPRDFAMRMILDVLDSTGITATAGIGPNLYLCKIALDIHSKHIPADKNGVCIAELDEMSYRRLLWDHQPLTDFWRIGRGYAGRLAANGLFTMGDIARCSMGRPDQAHNEELLYKLFGVNAELLIDHAWGIEPCTIADIKAYRPESSSMGSGQVLPRPYSLQEARLVVREMADALALELVDKKLATDQLVLMIGYESLAAGSAAGSYTGETEADRYGRRAPKPGHGSIRLPRRTSSSRLICEAALTLYDRLANPHLAVRRLSLAATHVVDEAVPQPHSDCQQLDMFTDYQADCLARQAEEATLAREKQGQQAILNIKKKYGKNAILKAVSLMESATAQERNQQIGGHKA